MFRFLSGMKKWTHVTGVIHHILLFICCIPHCLPSSTHTLDKMRAFIYNRFRVLHLVIITLSTLFLSLEWTYMSPSTHHFLSNAWAWYNIRCSKSVMLWEGSGYFDRLSSLARSIYKGHKNSGKYTWQVIYLEWKSDTVMQYKIENMYQDKMNA